MTPGRGVGRCGFDIDMVQALWAGQATRGGRIEAAAFTGRRDRTGIGRDRIAPCMAADESPGAHRGAEFLTYAPRARIYDPRAVGVRYRSKFFRGYHEARSRRLRLFVNNQVSTMTRSDLTRGP